MENLKTAFGAIQKNLDDDDTKNFTSLCSFLKYFGVEIVLWKKASNLPHQTECLN